MLMNLISMHLTSKRKNNGLQLLLQIPFLHQFLSKQEQLIGLRCCDIAANKHFV